MNKLQAYKNYQPVQYDYVDELPANWKFLPNTAIFQQRIEKNSVDLKPLSISAIKGIIWASENENTKDRTSVDKSEYLIVHKRDIPYNTMLMWVGAIGYSAYKGIVSPAYNIVKLKYEFNNDLYLSFYRYYFKSPKLISLLNTVISGIRDGQNIHWNDFKNLILPIPTKSEIIKLQKNFIILEKIKSRLLVEKLN